MENPNFGKNRSLLNQRLGRDVTGLVEQYIEHPNIPKIRNTMRQIVDRIAPEILNRALFSRKRWTDYLLSKYLEAHGPTFQSFIEHAKGYHESDPDHYEDDDYSNTTKSDVTSILKYLLPDGKLSAYGSPFLRSDYLTALEHKTRDLYNEMLVEMAVAEGYHSALPEKRIDLIASDGSEINVNIDSPYEILFELYSVYVCRQS